MQLNRQQRQKPQNERGIWVTDACDKCGQLFGSVRWTRKDEPGEWCPQACRDGIAVSAPTSNSKGYFECGTRLDGKRVDADFCSRTHTMRHRRRELSRTGQKRGISDNTPIGREGLTHAQNGSWTDTLTRPTQALETAVSASSSPAERGQAAFSGRSARREP